jgi:heat shock protein HtpX
MDASPTLAGTTTLSCPGCGASVPAEPGFVSWCEGCGWNVQPSQSSEPPTLLGRAFVALGRRSGRQLFERLAGSVNLQPELSAATVLAFLLAGMVHGLTLALALGGVLLIVGTWFNLGSALLGALMLGVAWVLRPRIGRLEATPLTRSEAPALYGLLDRVAQATGHPPVDALVVDTAFNASYSRVGLRGRPVVALGLPLLAVLEPQQKVALIAHEVAHGVNGDPVRGLFVGSAIDALQAWYDLLHPRALWEPERGLMAYPVLVSNLLMLGVAQLAYGVTYALSLLAWRDSQRAEYLADDLAARVAGAEAKRGLLAALQYQGVVELAVQNLALGRAKDDLVTELERAARAVPARERERLRRVGLLEDARIDATHPPTALRIAMLERRSAMDPLVIVGVDEDAAIRAELQRLERPIRLRLVDAYRSYLYVG